MCSRGRVAHLVCLAGLLMCAREAAAACDGTPGRPGAFSLDVEGLRRTFLVRPPARADGQTPAPLLVVFHPYGMNAQYMQSRVPGRVWPEALMIYPDGAPRPGAGAAPAWQGRPGELGDRDVRFFDALLAWAAAEQCVDPTRVFVMGYSNGAGFASVLACTRRAALAGVAMASGRLACEPEATGPFIATHGLRDGTIPYDEAVRTVRAWSARNGCRAAPQVGAPGCFAADACGSAPVTLCTYAGGHEYNTAFTRTMAEFFQAAPAR